MKYLFFNLIILLNSLSSVSIGQADNRWEITERNSIIYKVDHNKKLSYSDNIEMSGKRISAIIYYQIDENQNLIIERDVIFPQLRTFNKSSEPNWKKYRAYFRRSTNQSSAPSINVGNQIIVPSKIDSIEISGMLRFYYKPVQGLQVTKTIYPSMEERFLVEEWNIKNVSNEQIPINISTFNQIESELGYKGSYSFSVSSDAKEKIILDAAENYNFGIYFSAQINNESIDLNLNKARQSRSEFLKTCKKQLVLNTPEPIFNTLFYFAKIRATESIFESSMGLVHSPGGGNYYVGIWANDQVEYSGPFFPYLNYQVAKDAAFNTYKKFLANIPTDGKHIPYAFEVDGNFPMTHLDRGDAAMIAYGTSLYILNSGDIDIANQLWPLVTWSLEYCRSKQNIDGAVESESDEMEGRIETGNANLSTSTLYYGGLKYSMQIARALGQNSLALTYEKEKDKMYQVIENYFGANLEGLDTYKYYKENKHLRHWICLPLTMGINERKEATLKALFDLLWTDNGILVEYNPTEEIAQKTFWDRATLYALRGALKSGEREMAFQKLNNYSTKRLLGDHVPYPVEAYPENNMKHLSAESALYCRIFIEGMLGIEPVGFNEFQINPNFPEDWEELSMTNMQLGGTTIDILCKRTKNNINITIKSFDKILYQGNVKNRESINFHL